MTKKDKENKYTVHHARGVGINNIANIEQWSNQKKNDGSKNGAFINQLCFLFRGM